jgi:hypothetical protein
MISALSCLGSLVGGKQVLPAQRCRAFLGRCGKVSRRASGKEAGADSGSTRKTTAEAEHRICRGFERFFYGIVGSSSDDDLCGMTREESRGQAVRCGKHAVLRSDASESFQCFLGPLLIFRLVGEGVHANQGGCRD